MAKKTRKEALAWLDGGPKPGSTLLATRKLKSVTVDPPTELQEAIVLADWMRLRGLVFAHVPNEGRRGAKTGALLKRSGLAVGVPDYLIFTPPPESPGARGVALELKRVGRGKPTPAQLEWLQSLRECGWEGMVCWGAKDAIDWLKLLGY